MMIMECVPAHVLEEQQKEQLALALVPLLVHSELALVPLLVHPALVVVAEIIVCGGSATSLISCPGSC
jgi:hypothetical protein